MIFRLRQTGEGSPLYKTEIGSYSYGLKIRLALLSTPPRGDAVKSDYKALTYFGKDFHLTDGAQSRAHSSHRMMALARRRYHQIPTYLEQ